MDLRYTEKYGNVYNTTINFIKNAVKYKKNTYFFSLMCLGFDVITKIQ